MLVAVDTDTDLAGSIVLSPSYFDDGREHIDADYLM